MDIAIIDYGMGNLRSVAKAIESLAPELDVRVTADPLVVEKAARVIFPGQGAMPDCMQEIESRGLRSAIVAAARSKPFLGICIGVQLLFESSEEGDVTGLALMAGRVRRFASGMADAEGRRLKVPHMGWNRVRQTIMHPIWNDIADQTRFYFVHSYYVEPAEAGLVAGTSDYPQPFTCAVARDNVFAVQFHPEKSGQAGLQLLANFLRWQPAIALTPAHELERV